MNKPSQAFYDSEIANEIRRYTRAIDLYWRQDSEPVDDSLHLARIERLLIAERRKVAMECIAALNEDEHSHGRGDYDNARAVILARFPAPKKE